MKFKFLFTLSFLFLSFSVFGIVFKFFGSNHFTKKLLANEHNNFYTEKLLKTNFKKLPKIIEPKIKKYRYIELTFKNYTIPKEVQAVINQKPKTNKSLPNFFDDVEPDELATRIVDAMSNEELLSQCLMFGWVGQDPNAKVANWVSGGLGSIKIFGWNTANTKILASSIHLLQIKALQSRFSIPLFVATDQEGGRVRHVKGLTSEVPSALDCGASAIPADSYYNGYFIGRELREIGININFAPTVDLYSDYGSTIIASRSFGDNPESVAQLASAFSSGLKDAGLLSTAKHFPGHGDTSLDSHGYLPKINITKEIFYNRELVPFKAVINSGVCCIMSGHLNFPQFMEKNQPATFSKNILKDVLRNELKFEGLVVTDDMMMLAALNYAGSFSKALTLALESGNNIIESSRTPSKSESVWKENILLMQNDFEFYKIVKSSAKKIILKKLKYFKSNLSVPILPQPKDINKKFPIENSYNFYQSFACRAITILEKNKNDYEKISYEDKVLVLSDYENLRVIAKEFFPLAKTESLTNVFLSLKQFDKIIFCISDNHSANIFKTLKKNFPNKTYFIFSVMTPVFIKDINEKNIFIAYNYSDFSFIGLCAALRGDFIPSGKTPIVNLEL